MRTKIVATVLGLLLAVTICAQTPHAHRTKDLTHYAARVVDVKNGEIYFTDLEAEAMVVSVLHMPVDKVFRLVNMTGDSEEGAWEIKGLGGLKNAVGVLTFCTGCKRITGLRTGKVDFYSKVDK